MGRYVDLLKGDGLIDYPFMDFSGGLNTKASKALGAQQNRFALKPNQLTVLNNWELDESGGLVKRKGYEKFLTTGLGAGKPIHTLYELVQKSGTRFTVAGEGKDLYLYNSGTGVLDRKYRATSTNPWVFATFLDLLVGVNGVDVPIKFDGVDWRVLNDTVLTGTISKNGTTALVGVGTLFNTEVAAGDRIICPGGGATEILTVQTVTDDLNIVLSVASDFTASTQTGWVYKADAPEGATTIAEHRNRLWAIKELNLQHSALSAPNDWVTANNAGTLPIPIGRKSYKGTFLIPQYNRLIIGLDSALDQLTGTSPSVTADGYENFFRIEPISSYQGALNQFAALPVVDDVHFASRRGIHSLETTEAQSLYGDVKEAYLSAIIEPTFREFNPARFGQVFGVDSKEKSQVMWIGPTGAATENNTALVWDYYHSAWFVFTPFPFASGVIARDGDVDRLLLGGYDGEIYRYGTVDSDNGVAISSEARYLTVLEDVSLVKDFRFATMLFGAETATTYGILPEFDFMKRTGIAKTVITTVTSQVFPFTLPFVFENPNVGSIIKHVPINGYGTYLELVITHNALNQSGKFRGGVIYAEPRRAIYG